MQSTGTITDTTSNNIVSLVSVVANYMPYFQLPCILQVSNAKES